LHDATVGGYLNRCRVRFHSWIRSGIFRHRIRERHPFPVRDAVFKRTIRHRRAVFWNEYFLVNFAEGLPFERRLRAFPFQLIRNETQTVAFFPFPLSGFDDIFLEIFLCFRDRPVRALLVQTVEARQQRRKNDFCILLPVIRLFLQAAEPKRELCDIYRDPE
jgi:hypothetical protein